MNSSFNKILKGSLLGVIGGILSGAINFLSLPILITLYGKSNYGLIGVAMSANAFLQILNMGVPTGAVKHFSEWLEAKNFKALSRGMQSNLFFFTLIALVNSGILVYLSFNSEAYFNVSNPDILSRLLIILALTTFFNWYFVSLQHLLMAHEQIAWVNFGNSLGSILNILALAAAYYADASIETYFIVYTVTTLITIPLNLYKCAKMKILQLKFFVPKLHKLEMRAILGYSLGLFAVGLLQYLANQSQPLILSMLDESGDIAVANYKILQNITYLVSIMTGMFLQNFMPYVAKINVRGDNEQILKFVFITTKWLSVFIFFICSLIAINSEEILRLYVGDNGNGLSIWLSIWMIGLMFQNNQGISSLILGSGRFRPLIIGLSIASFTAVSVSLLNVTRLGVGVAAISYFLYKLIEACFFYGYYLPRIAKISSINLFNTSIRFPLLFSFLSVIIAKLLVSIMNFNSIYIQMGFVTVLSAILYLTSIWFFMIEPLDKSSLLKYLKRDK